MAGPWEAYGQPPAPVSSGAPPWAAFQMGDTAAPSTNSDVLKSGGVGLAKGLLSMPTTLSDMSGMIDSGIARATAYGLGGLGLLPSGKTASDLIDAAHGLNLPEARFSSPTSPGVVDAVQQDITGPMYQPQTTAGKYAETVGSFIPATLATGGGGVVNVGKGLLSSAGGGVVSEFAGERAKAAGASPFWEGAARMLGGTVGANVPGVVSRGITPLPASPSRLPLLAAAEQEGIPLTAGQKTGYKPLQWAEAALSDMPLAGGGAKALEEAQKEAFTHNVTSKALAPPGTLATPEGLTTIKNNLQDRYKSIYKNNSADLTDTKFGSDLMDVAKNYDLAVSVQNQSPIVAHEINKFINTQGRTLPGDQYQTWRTKLGDLAEQFRNSPEGTALNGIRDALDGVMARSLSPEDAAKLADTHKAYAVYKTLVSTANKPGAATAEGYVSPLALRSEVSNFNPDAYARGVGPLAQISRVGAGLLQPLPQSGTGPRTFVQHALSAAGPMVGAVVGSGHGMEGAAAGAGLGAMIEPFIGATVGRSIMSPLVQQYLGNQVMSRAGLAGIGPGPYPGLLASDPSVQDRLRQRGLLQH